ncbi:InlB B-repeat-containing protein [Methanobrevibacter curvatus]|nr:InlB B-repeat-containing protein [Methanobrevibacter curvatus]
MKTKKIISILIIAIIAILMITTVLAPAQAVDTTSKVKVKWNANEGKIANSKVVTTNHYKGAKIAKLPKTPKKSGYVFSGWYTKKSGGTKITTATKIKSSKTFYAQWKKQYTLTFNPNGGTVTTKTKKLTDKKAYSTLPTPKRSGYTFTGWYTTKNGGIKVSTTTKMVAKNVVVYAHWKKGSSSSNRVLNLYEKELVGAWSYSGAFAGTYRFNADGTYIDSTGGVLNGYVWHSYITAKWAVTSKGKVKLTNIVGTWTNLGNPSSDYKNKAFSDKIDLYKIQINNGKLQIAIHSPSSYIEGSEYNKWTIDEYITKGYPDWYTKE